MPPAPRTRESDEQAAERRLRALGGECPELGGLVRLRLALLAAWPARDRLVVDLRGADAAVARLETGVPWLDGTEIPVDGDRAAALLRALAEPAGGTEARTLVDALRRGRFDPVEAMGLAVAQRPEALAPLAALLGVPEPWLSALLGLALEPVLTAARERIAASVDVSRWIEGFCPCCGAWPALACLEGLDRTRWLACGRCGQTWRRPWLFCAYCGNEDHRTLGYLQAGEAEQRRVTTCERCRGYLKSVTVLALPAPPLVHVEDMATLDLDLGALAAGWSRPEPPGYAVETRLVRAAAAPPDGGWLAGLADRFRGRT